MTDMLMIDKIGANILPPIPPCADAAMAERVIAFIADQIDAGCSPTLEAISAAVHLSPFHMQRMFKKVTGITPRQYAEAYRLERLKAHLRDGMPITEAVFTAGYGSSSRLYERADTHLGMTPGEYSRRGAGMHIDYSIVDCALGRLLVGSTARGVCAVHLGDAARDDCDVELEATLFAEYPLATFQRGRVPYCQWVETITEHLNGEGNAGLPHIALPLDLQATAFQLRVWNEVRKIPYGETRTYGAIAHAIGQPGAASAVAEAIHQNPVAVLIPCHRTERIDGDTTRYYSRRGKLAREQLIAHEREQVEKEEASS